MVGVAIGVALAGWWFGTGQAGSTSTETSGSTGISGSPIASPVGLSDQNALPYDMTLSPPPPGTAPQIAVATAIDEASQMDPADLASAAIVVPVLALLTRPAPVPVDPNTDEPLVSPSMEELLVWDIQVKGICASNPGEIKVSTAAPSQGACQYTGAHIFVDATGGGIVLELFTNPVS